MPEYLYDWIREWWLGILAVPVLLALIFRPDQGFGWCDQDPRPTNPHEPTDIDLSDEDWQRQVERGLKRRRWR